MVNITRSLCFTPSCIQLATNYVSNLSPNFAKLDPCAGDFEEMVCGGWRSRYELGAKDNINVFNMLSQAGSDKLRSVIEGVYPGNSNHSHFSPMRLRVGRRRANGNDAGDADADVDERNFEMMKTAYRACMNVEEIRAAGLDPVLDLLGELEETFIGKGGNGSWSGSWNASGSDWSDAYMFVQRLGAGGPLRLGVSKDNEDPYKRVIAVVPRAVVGLGSADVYRNASAVAEYTAVLAEVLGKVYPRGSQPAEAKKVAEDLVQFEKALVQVAPAGQRNGTSSTTAPPVSVSETSKLIPQLNLEKIIRGLAPEGYNPDKLVLSDRAFLTNISRILADASPETIKAYFAWRTISAVQDKVIAPGAFDRWNQLRYDLRLASPPAADRSKFCMDYITSGLGWLVSRFFIEGFFSAQDKQMSDQIIADIRHVYTEKFRNLDWMDAATKVKAMEKVEKMVQKVGYPTDYPNITSPTSLAQYYSSVNITSSFFSTALSLVNFTALQPWKSLTPGHTTWDMLPTTVNAMYDAEYNEILFPAAILQSPFFHRDLPPAVNYGAFGAVAGHEVSHAFDNYGSRYGADGKRVDWWGNGTKQEYERRVQCFVKQFDGFAVNASAGNMTADGSFQVNGTRTLGENVSDSAGVGVAFEAWQERKAIEGPGQGLPGLQRFSEEQMFFVAFANMWCSKFNKKGLEGYSRDSHSPPPVRVKGMAANSRAFRKAFGCEVKEPVCELW